MAAAAFTQTLILRGTKNGKVVHMPMNVSDVVGQFAQTPAGDNYIQLSNDQDYSVIDIIVVTGGTDTNFQDILINGLQSPLRISNKSNLNTSNFRQFATAPVTFAAGAQLKFKQAA